MQHSVPIDDVKGDAEWFLCEHNMGVYSKILQVESTLQLGWLLFSTIAMDQNLLEDVIGNRIGVKIALRWKYIKLEQYEPDAQERKKWMALHAEVDSEEYKKASQGIPTLYGSTSAAFPLGIQMQLVPEYCEVKGNIVMMGKHTQLRVRQASFNSLIMAQPSDDIMQLDYLV